MPPPDDPAEPPADAFEPLTGHVKGVTDPARQAPIHAHAVADGVARPLDPRVIALHRIAWAITTASLSFMMLIAASVLMFALPLPAAPALVLTGAVLFMGALAWFSYWWPAVAYRYASYRVDASGIEIRRGVIWRFVIAVPRSRVQHIDVAQGPIERLFGLGTMHIYTAGTSFARVDLQGLDHALALLVRDHLLPEGAGDAV